MMTTMHEPTHEAEYVPTIVIGGGQAGLSVGYHLQRQGLPFAILDASERVGDAWRQRWDSLRLFSPARLSALDGFPFPAHRDHFPTKDEMGDYLEAYAERFELPVRSGVRVERLSRRGERFVIEAGEQRYEADQVVVAMSSLQRPKIPAFAGDLDQGVVQLHSSAYRAPSQLNPGPVLLVGVGNSGAEIAAELAPLHDVWLSGRVGGELPFSPAGTIGRRLIKLVFRGLFHRVLTTSTPIGRKARAKLLTKAAPLIRVKSKHLAAAGVHRVPRVAGIEDGMPVLEDGQRLEVANVIWCTGFHPGFSWIDLPVLDDHGDPAQKRGIVASEPGLYFVGLMFMYALSSEMIHGVGRDAAYVAKAVAARAREVAVGESTSEAVPAAQAATA